MTAFTTPYTSSSGIAAGEKARADHINGNFTAIAAALNDLGGVGHGVFAPGQIPAAALAGSIPISALLKSGVPGSYYYDMGSTLISNVTDPASAQDAATRNYVDSQVAYGQIKLGGWFAAQGLTDIWRPRYYNQVTTSWVALTHSGVKHNSVPTPTTNLLKWDVSDVGSGTKLGRARYLLVLGIMLADDETTSDGSWQSFAVSPTDDTELISIPSQYTNNQGLLQTMAIGNSTATTYNRPSYILCPTDADGYFYSKTYDGSTHDLDIWVAAYVKIA